jgi:hypothetical protein
MKRADLEGAVKEYGAWLPEPVFLSLVRDGHRGTAEDIAEDLDVLTVASVTGTLYRAEDLKPFIP